MAKTTTTVNMAAILAKDYGKRVLVIDADAQCNTSEFLGISNHTCDNFTLADALRNRSGNTTTYFMQYTKVTGVDLLPADESLMDLDLTKVEDAKVNVSCLQNIKPRLAETYDFVIIDCPPAFNAAAAAALLAADDVIIPIKLDAFSLRGMANLTRQISNMRKINPKLALAGLLPTMMYKSDNIKDSVAALKASGFNIFTGIRRTNKVDDMTFAQEPLISSSPKSAACVDYRRFVAEYLGGEK